ncbi:AAA family ATPase [Chthonobacter rhizosphaerae]|uniref:AAA family ATPase n=1 Tax=Chthonobacter rhizosphaerae TaxID=2735553 RepID=UPI0015EEB0D5|nr:AAA family ATPase [Chthonobacter rhizosphaerae]
MIINVRGISGSGKTVVVRRLLAAYGPAAEVLRSADGRRLLGVHPRRDPGPPLAVIGCYDRPSGGCDAIRQTDGGLALAFDLALRESARGHDVILEGNRLAVDVELTRRLALRAPLVVLLLDTPVEVCVRSLMARRRLSRSAAPALEARLRLEADRLAEASRRLEPAVDVLATSRDEAVARALDLLGGNIRPPALAARTGDPAPLPCAPPQSLRQTPVPMRAGRWAFSRELNTGSPGSEPS